MTLESEETLRGRAEFHNSMLKSFAKALADGLDPENAGRALDTVFDQKADEIAATLRARIPDMVADHAAMWTDVERIIRETWGEALDSVYAVVVCAEEMARIWNFANLKTAEANNDQLFLAVSTVSAVAIRTAFAAHLLLTRGFPDDAAARARSIHEAAVVAHLLAQHDAQLARRFWDHRTVEQRAWAGLHNLHAEALGRPSIPPADIDALDTAIAALATEHGTGFLRGNGCARPLFRPGTGSISFEALEHRAGMQHMRPDYKANSLPVHANAWGSMLNSEGGGIVASWRLTGLADAGSAVITSLLNLFATVVTSGHRGAPNQYDILALASLSRLVEATNTALLEAEEAAVRRLETEELRPEWPEFPEPTQWQGSMH